MVCRTPLHSLLGKEGQERDVSPGDQYTAPPGEAGSTQPHPQNEGMARHRLELTPRAQAPVRALSTPTLPRSGLRSRRAGVQGSGSGRTPYALSSPQSLPRVEASGFATCPAGLERHSGTRSPVQRAPAEAVSSHCGAPGGRWQCLGPLVRNIVELGYSTAPPTCLTEHRSLASRRGWGP